MKMSDIFEALPLVEGEAHWGKQRPHNQRICEVAKCHAVNCHDDLVKAVRDLVDLVECYIREEEDRTSPMESALPVLDKYRKLLAKTEA